MRYSGENEKVIVSQPQVYINEDSLPIRGTVNENGVEVLDATGYETLFNKSVEKLYQRTLTGTSIPVSVFDDVTYPNAGLQCRQVHFTHIDLFPLRRITASSFRSIPWFFLLRSLIILSSCHYLLYNFYIAFSLT